MSWTFNIKLETDIDRVRWLIGDINEQSQIVQDETISSWLTYTTDIFEAAALTADSIATGYSQRASIKIDGFSVDYSEKIKSFRDLANRLRNRDVPGSLGIPSISGISRGVMDGVKDNPDRIPLRIEALTDEPS